MSKRISRSKGLKPSNENTVIFMAGSTVDQTIDDTLEKNYMPYAMSVIMSRALPEIDGFKPSHRKLLYTMYKMGLLGSARTKSANIVGQTMKLNPHGDSAIYDTMVRLSRGHEALLHPYIDSKGNFGKFYSRDMAYAASRYTEARLDKICLELFSEIDKDTVDFVDNYDNSLKEPALLPVTFPSILVNSNSGIAVGMASSICSFNLAEVCKTTIALLKNKFHKIEDTMIAPDFSGGGFIVYDESQFKQIYNTGRGSFKVRASYSYDKSNHCIDIDSIPPTTTCESIIEKIIDLIKQAKIKEISDIRDETGIDGMKITIDLKRSVDPNKFMLKLYRLTPLEDTFVCNFNVLVNAVPRVLGIREILNEWIDFRINCVKRRTTFECDKKQKKLHLLIGLKKILLDIDKAISIIRNTEEESKVITNLMDGFAIDEIQAEYVANIKLRHLNKEFILNRIEEISQLNEDIKKLTTILESDTQIKTIIAEELANIAKQYGQVRRSKILYSPKEYNISQEKKSPDYPVTLFFTKYGYFKKITAQSLRLYNKQKLKEKDKIIQTIETSNRSELLFFTNRCQVYKLKLSEISETKASVLGDFVAAKLNMDKGELPIFMLSTKDYDGELLFFFQNGKVAKIPLSVYKTKTNRKRLTSAYSDKSPLCKMFYISKNQEFLLKSSAGKLLLINSDSIACKVSRSSQGVAIMTLKSPNTLSDVEIFTEDRLKDAQRYRVKNFPAVGKQMR